MSKLSPSFNDRQKASADAKKALLEKMRSLNPANQPGFAERQAERARVAEEREKRHAERDARKAAELARIAQEKLDAKLAAEKAAEEARLAEEYEKNRASIELAERRAAGKAKRDAAYAARKERRDEKAKKKIELKTSSRKG